MPEIFNMHQCPSAAITIHLSSSLYAVGVTLFNSATFYGPLNEVGFGANLRLLKTAIADLDRSKIQLMVKICMDTR
jgi:aryl-alcohol dehydrogenase-like predicted oxidoreductase